MTHPSKIILIGFMGSGKTTAAARLAPMLGTRLFEMDTLIVEASGLDSIPAIFQQHGETKFRELETSVAESLSEVREGVISTGGGVISNPANVRHLRANGGVVVYLQTSFDSVCSRIEEIESRPLFKDRTRAAELHRSRAPLYESAADIIVPTDELSEEEVVQYVYQKVRSIR